MRAYALFALAIVLLAVRGVLAEDQPQGFAPACTTAACPHPATTVYPTAPQQFGPQLFAPLVDFGTDAVAPLPIRDLDVRIASN